MKLRLLCLVAVAAISSVSVLAISPDRKKSKNRTSDEQTVSESSSEANKPQEFSQEDGDLTRKQGTVTLVVSGEGVSVEDATKNALRGAIEQAFGTFVSANTKIINDDLIKDEIVTITSGNIQGYKVISSEEKGQNKEVMVEAVVSIGNLVSYANNKGMSTELSGATFLMNKRMRELNKKNTEAVFRHLRDQMYEIASRGLFDYKINVGTPQDNGNRTTIPCEIIVNRNSNLNKLIKTMTDCFNSINMTDAEIQEYKETNTPYYIHYWVDETKVDETKVQHQDDREPLDWVDETKVYKTMVYKSECIFQETKGSSTTDLFPHFLANCAAYGFKINDNLGNSYDILRVKDSLGRSCQKWNSSKIKRFPIRIQDYRYYQELGFSMAEIKKLIGQPTAKISVWDFYNDRGNVSLLIEISMNNEDLEKLEKIEIVPKRLDVNTITSFEPLLNR